MVKKSYYIFASFTLSLLLLSCDKRAPKVLYMPDMVDVATISTLEDYIDPPDNSVSRRAVYYPKDVEAAEADLVSPIKLSEESHEVGKKIYNTYCIVCHGANAKGKGSLTNAYPTAPDLTTDDYSARKDGFFYYRIVFGAAVMPGYGHSIKEEERWPLIQYLRTLQAK